MKQDDKPKKAVRDGFLQYSDFCSKKKFLGCNFNHIFND